MSKKMKVNKAGSKKNKSAKGTKKFGKLKKLIIGSLIIGVAYAAFTTNFIPQKGNEDGAYSIYYGNNLQDNYNIILYERGMPDLEPESIENLYIFSSDGENSLIRINPKNEKNITLLHGNANLDDLENDSKSAVSLSEIALLEDIMENSDIDAKTKVADDKLGGTDYNVFLNRDVLDELLNDENCLDPIKCYTTKNGDTYDNLAGYLAAVVELQNSRSK